MLKEGEWDSFPSQGYNLRHALGLIYLSLDIPSSKLHLLVEGLFRQFCSLPPRPRKTRGSGGYEKLIQLE